MASRINHHHPLDKNKKRKLQKNGNGNDKDSNLPPKKKTHASSFKRLFCDLDGVLVDFNAGVEQLCGKPPQQLAAGVMWSRIHGSPSFFQDLPWTPDGQELWEAIRPLAPTILTGVSRGRHLPQDKYAWCKRELCVETHHVNMAGPQTTHVRVVVDNDDTSNTNISPPHPKSTPIMTCWSRHKHCESGPGHILIDDRQDLQAKWQAAGGTFVWHTSTASTLARLCQLQILPSSSRPAGAASLVASSKQGRRQRRRTAEEQPPQDE